MKYRILELLEGTQWTLIQTQDNIKMLQFQNGKIKANVYWSTMTIVMNTQEGGQVVHKDCELKEFYEIMDLKRTWWDKLKGLFK